MPAEILKSEMDDAALAGGHGIQAKWLAGFANAFGGYASGELQFFDAKRTVVTGIEADAIEVWRIEAQRANSEIF